MIDKETRSLVKNLKDIFLSPKYDDYVKQRKDLITIISGRSLDAEAIEYLFLSLEHKAQNFSWTLSTEATATPMQIEKLEKQHDYKKFASKLIGDDLFKYRKSIKDRRKEEVDKYKSDSCSKAGKGNKDLGAYNKMKEYYERWQKDKSSYKNQEEYINDMIVKTGKGRSTVQRNLKEIKK